MNDIAIELSSVSFSYSYFGLFKKQKKHVLSQINLKVYKGETLGILGGNGAGKSTLLKLLAGIYKPDSGTINHFDNLVSLQSLSAGFDMELTGKDNALFGAMLLGYSYKEAVARLNAICEFSELGESFLKPVKTYSTGMRARLGFSVAMTMQTDVLLIDEVLGVGDHGFRVKANREILKKVQSDMTVIIVSHSEEQIRTLCDRVVAIEFGQLIESDVE